MDALSGCSPVSRAFVREPDGDAPPEPLAETPVSPHRNFVTPRGLALLQAELARLDRILAESASEDVEARRHAARDRRYVSRRLATAEPVTTPPPGEDGTAAAFGAAVGLALANGRHVTWRIVGEDEADPAQGRISWTSPVARLLIGATVGDEVTLPTGAAEVLSVDAAPEPVPPSDPPLEPSAPTGAPA